MRFSMAAIFILAAACFAQRVPRPVGQPRAQLLKGAYGPFRANNHIVSYHLDVRVDPVAKSIAGKNTITFKMLQDGSRIQMDLTPELAIDKIVMGPTELSYTRDTGAVFIDFPETLRRGNTYSIDFSYSGKPTPRGQWGGVSFAKDPSGHDWITTSCEGIGAMTWWPNKEQWKDKCEHMEISVAIPNGLVDVSNGTFAGKKDLGDGYTRWDWMVHYPINNYCVSLNIGNYVHFSSHEGDLPLDFYALPEHLDKAKQQFAQANGMIQAYQHYFGEYPFKRDGYKLIDVPYSGMEHQSAVTYGNRFENGYLGMDWTGVGISRRFDFIIIHESGHEWFGNSISAQDPSDMWIHEGWTTYLECLYCEFMYGKADGLKYTNGYKNKVRNQNPIVGDRGVGKEPGDEDQYFKGALFLNTLRSVVGDDKKWFALIHDFYQHFKHHAILTEDVIGYFCQHTGMNLKPVFNEYLHHGKLPILDLRFGDGTVDYRWDAEEPGFAMPIEVGAAGHWEVVKPTSEWQTMKTSISKSDFGIPVERYFVGLAKS